MEGSTCLELRGRGDNLQALSITEKPNHFNFFLDTGRLPLPAPIAFRKNQVIALDPGIWAEVMDATISLGS